MPQKYYGITISAHILSYTPTSVVQILNETRKPFFIDPMTFVYARDLRNIARNGKIRRSYKTLAEDYGPPFSTSCESGMSLRLSLFKDDQGGVEESAISEVCQKVLYCQRNNCQVTTDFSKYERLLRKGLEPFSVSPSFLVAPYFFANHYGQDWYNISLRCAETARSLKGDKDLYPVICISRDILWDKAQVSKIAEDYEGFDGYLLWVDSLDEQNVQGYELDGLKTLVTELVEYGKPVYSLYGGYLCDL
ncbi:hypothetical protein MUP59_03030, partial [Candidatus Bathyarchaeota archaeon]|nr:hypothetical protein [Candidatus Bathyarchaeota archaeon]